MCLLSYLMLATYAEDTCLAFMLQLVESKVHLTCLLRGARLIEQTHQECMHAHIVPTMFQP